MRISLLWLACRALLVPFPTHRGGVGNSGSMNLPPTLANGAYPGFGNHRHTLFFCISNLLAP